VVIQRLIADAVALLVNPAKRLLEQARLGVARRYCRFSNVEPVDVHADRHERSRLVGVGQLQHVPLDEIDARPNEFREDGIALQELPRGIHERAGIIRFPISGAGGTARIAAAEARLRTRRAVLRFFREDLFVFFLCGDCHRELTST